MPSNPLRILLLTWITTSPLMSQSWQTVAQITPNASCALVALTSGRVENIPIHTGQVVEKNQPLVHLDTTILKLECERASLVYQKAQAEHDEAKRQYQKIETLYSRPEPSVTKKAFEEAAHQLKMTQYALELAKKQQEITLAQLEHATLRAPFTGIITKIYTDIGHYIVPSPECKLLEIEQHDPLALEFSLPASLLPHISTQTPVHYTYQNAVYDTHIEQIAPTVDPASQAVACKALLTQSIPPGSRVKIEVDLP